MGAFLSAQRAPSLAPHAWEGVLLADSPRLPARFYAYFMPTPSKRYGQFTRDRLMRVAVAFPARIIMADIIYLGVALASFAVLALTIFFCERL